MRTLALFLVLALASLPAQSARAQETAPGRGDDAPAPVLTAPRTPAEVAALLSGFEAAPSDETWRAFGPSVVPLLRSVVADGTLPSLVRVRAVQALGAFATSEVRTELRRLLRSPQPLMAREAGLALQRAFGAAAEDDVASLLAHADPAVREGAIEALARIGSAGARARLEQHAARERDEALRARIARALEGGDRLRGGGGSSPDGEGTR